MMSGLRLNFHGSIFFLRYNTVLTIFKQQHKTNHFFSEGKEPFDFPITSTAANSYYSLPFSIYSIPSTDFCIFSICLGGNSVVSKPWSSWEDGSGRWKRLHRKIRQQMAWALFQTSVNICSLNSRINCLHIWPWATPYAGTADSSQTKQKLRWE